jgi:Zinc finger, C2H2 type
MLTRMKLQNLTLSAQKGWSAVYSASSEITKVTYPLKPPKTLIFSKFYPPPGVKFMCTECTDLFCRFETIQSHIVRLHFHDRKKRKGIYLPKYRCLLCPTERQATLMPKHLIKAHKMTVVFVCPTCETQFSQASDQERHMKDERWDSSRVNERCEFMCHECGKSFKTREVLWFHSFDHRGFKP